MPTAPADPQLDLFAPRADKAPRVTGCDVARLVALLRGRGWTKREALTALDPTMDERQVRAIAEISDGAVLSWPGSPGYRLYDEATDEERDHADGAFGSQIEKMSTRQETYRRRRTRLHGHLLTDRPQHP